MKRNPRVLFLCLLASILFAPWLHAQPISKYPYGMYVYWNNGIYYNAGTFNQYKNASNENIFQVWNKTVNMNYFFASPSMGSPSAYEHMHYLKNNYLPSSLKGKINYTYIAPVVTYLTDGHYLKFNSVNAAKNAITFSPSTPFEIYQTGGNYRVYSPSDIVVAKTNAAALPLPPTRNSGYVIDNLNVIGPPNNLHVIRPRSCNTYYIDSVGYAAFHVRVGIRNSNAANTLLTLTMTNGNPGPGNGYDNNNNGTFTTTVNLSNTTALQYVTLDFTLNLGTSSNVNFSAYVYSPKLMVSSSMDFGKSFDIESITLYDDMGLQVVEQNYNYLSTLTDLTNLISELGNYTDANDIQTLDLCDEPCIGNFQTTKAVVDYMRGHIASGKTFKTSSTLIQMVNYSNLTEFNATMDRFFSEVNPDYYAPDIYVFDPDPNTTYNQNIVNDFYTFTKNISSYINSHNLSTKLISVMQLHKWRNGQMVQLREPTRYEMLATAYLSLLNGYKGILWWYSGPEQADVYNRCLYPYLDPLNVPSGQNYNSFLLNTNNMVAYKKDAINKVASFLNYRSNANSGSQIIGDLLYSGVFKEAQIIGNGSNYVDNLALGELTRSQVIRADVFDQSTGDVATGTNLIGINYFTIPGDDNNTSYYLITNLNQDGHSCRVRLFFNSYNSKDFLNIYTLNDPAQLDGRAYPKNGVVLFTLPADGVMVLKVVNSDENLLYGGGFPKGVRFGAAYLDPNTSKTSIYLDNNFFSPDNDQLYSVDYPVEVISLNNGAYTDFATFRVLNANYNATQMQIEYKKYAQNTNNTFTPQTSGYTYVVTKPFPSGTASTAYKVGPLAYDSDNNGIDELCYYVAYNNQYNIYKVGTSTPIRTYSNANGCYSLAGYVLGAKYLIGSTLTPTFYIYNNYAFYRDKNNNGAISSDEKQDMGTWFANGWGPIPFTGDWYGDAIYDYGVFEWNNYYKNTIFECNFSGTDGYSYFEFPYAMHNSKPIVWKPRNLSIAKTGFEAAAEAAEIPSEYSISQNFPNPFNPATTIRFALPAESRVTLEVFNILGERVAELVNDVRPAGTMDVRFDGSNLASGIYIYKFNATSLENGKHFQKINKMMLLK